MGNKSDRSENAKIGHMLMTARKSRGVSQEEIAKATGMTANHISSIERGVCKASIELMLGYCKRLDMSPNDIFGGSSRILPELGATLARLDTEEQEKILAIIKLMYS